MLIEARIYRVCPKERHSSTKETYRAIITEGEEIAKYNNGLFRYRRYNDNWFTCGFIADVPEYLKPIVLNLSK